MMAAVTTRLAKMILIAAILAAFGLPAAANAATITQTTPFEGTVLACNGVDTIQLKGQLLIVFTETFNSAGGAILAIHGQPQGISGTDQNKTKYLGTGLTLDLSVFSPTGVVNVTFIDRFHIQATTGAQSFDFSATVHITVLPDGTLTAAVGNFSGPC
jgi:hypothetical protein